MSLPAPKGPSRGPHPTVVLVHSPGCPRGANCASCSMCHSPVGSPIELRMHGSGVHAGPVGGRCQVVLVHTVSQAVWDAAWVWEGQGSGSPRALPCRARGFLPTSAGVLSVMDSVSRTAC